MVNNDVNDQFSQYSGDKKNISVKGSFALVAFLGWFVFCGIWILLYIPKIKEAVSKTDFIKVVTNLEEYSDIPDSTTGYLFFTDIHGNCVRCLSKIKYTGASKYHDVLEALLDGPNNYALETGAVSCIPGNTVLNGITVQGKWAFADFSSDFLDGSSVWTEDYQTLAFKQIILTLNGLDNNITELVVLIDGAEYSTVGLEA